ncbi:MAG: hypothetical protein SFT81_05415 [Candidatus Caenarcaniphilales bacterium]|nr:hypothetical protein [Candidatus Caenarcaniphilales bacterium]
MNSKAQGAGDEDSYYVLGWEQPNEKVAILCRGKGPALCKSWKESLKLRTNLINDPRARRNQNAQLIIQELRIYRLAKGELLLWRPGDLWAYVDKRILEKIEN